MACTDCEKLAKKITELELKVKTLIEIRDTEDFIDSLLPNSPEAKLLAGEKPLKLPLNPSSLDTNISAVRAGSG